MEGFKQVFPDTQVNIWVWLYRDYRDTYILHLLSGPSLHT